MKNSNKIVSENITINKIGNVVERTLDDLHAGFEADGYSIELTSIDEECLDLRLVLTPETCMDCIMPTDYLITLFKNMIKEETNLNININIDDPR